MALFITQAHINMPELQDAVDKGYLQVDSKIMKPGGNLVITKATVEPVWYLPGIAKAWALQNHRQYFSDKRQQSLFWSGERLLGLG